MNIQPSLHTRRLLLRPFEMNDASAIRELAGDKRIAEATFIPHPYKDVMAQEFIRDCNTGWEEGNGISFAITLRDGEKLVGSISLKDVNKEHRRAEMGYWVGVPWWGNGYATEAALEVIDFGFRYLNLTKSLPAIFIPILHRGG